MQLFTEKRDLGLVDSDIWYYPNFLNNKQANEYFDILKTDTPWRQDDIKVFGKVYAQPRLTALYGNNGRSYSYSNITMESLSFTKELKQLKSLVDKEAGVEFTTCLLNLYRDGKDSNGWHSDDEKELGQNPVIASVSLGASRFFHLRHKSDKTIRHKILLEHGSLLLMRGETQHFWQHQIAKTAKKVEERINLTFRIIQ
ncbi:alpha-ketoglutarate-dependent dioxygenase AlkB family protein [Flagellimonas sp.]|uniref:alpha-ketoglutarate-dependent dioxygenase AlkB family protein n=1 Tax=Flagellimonas sp. TaxID=2058762 RepID=UPI003F4A02BB